MKVRQSPKKIAKKQDDESISSEEDAEKDKKRTKTSENYKIGELTSNTKVRDFYL